MSDDDLPTFDEGDIIQVRGREYGVDQVDPSARHPHGVLQYRLEPIGDAPPGRLKPKPEAGVFVWSVYHEVGPADVTVQG